MNQEDEGIKVCLTEALLKVPRCKQGMMEGHCRVSRWKGPPRLACIKFTKLLVGAFKFVDKFPGKEDLNGFSAIPHTHSPCGTVGHLIRFTSVKESRPEAPESALKGVY